MRNNHEIELLQAVVYCLLMNNYHFENSEVDVNIPQGPLRRFVKLF